MYIYIYILKKALLYDTGCLANPAHPERQEEKTSVGVNKMILKVIPDHRHHHHHHMEQMDMYTHLSRL